MNARDSLTPGAVAPTVIHRNDYTPPSHRIAWVRLDFTLGLECTRVINEFE
jgi:hypothetical protein